MLNWVVSEMKVLGRAAVPDLAPAASSAMLRRTGGLMIYIVLNAVVILAATLASLAFGSVYYSIASRGRPRAFGLTGTFVTAFIAEFWLCAILAGALILAPPKGGVWTMTTPCRATRSAAWVTACRPPRARRPMAQTSR